MNFKDNRVYGVEIERKEGENIMYVNFMGANKVPSLAESGEVMGGAVEGLADNSNVSRIVFVQQRNYNYSAEQIALLSEVARISNYLIKSEEVLSSERLSLFGNVQEVQGDLIYLLNALKRDPVGAYIEIKGRVQSLRKQLESGEVINRNALVNYIRFLEKFQGLLDGTKIIQKVMPLLGGHVPGDREIYKEIFRPDILPNFTFTRLVAALPKNAELIDQYEIELEDEKVDVTILKREGEGKHFYHVMPTEYSLSDEHHALVNLARNVLAEHRPKAEEFTDPEKTRQVFFNVARDLLADLGRSKGIKLSYKDLSKLSRVLVRHTIGFGLIEVLLADERLQDVVLNAPIAQNPIFVRHGEFDECVTNIIPSYEDADSWAAKLRLQSGRPLDEANPVLDSDLEFGNTKARVAAVIEPLSPRGLAFAFRRHRDEPWTLPLFIENKMINSLAAGLFSFIIDGSRTLLVAGTRSAGKTSLLGSLMLEIMPKFRTIVIEDTLELPVNALRKIGYDILSMKVRSALVEGTSEIEASEGIRTSLRLGDSALIVGEVRSEEAKALYEAMRIGALANVVAGTIHGDSPYGVFDRVVNDLGVERTSFKATDLIIVTNPIKSADGLHSKKRVVKVTEVRKHWERDPEAEKGFVDLLRYNVETDELEPTDELINGDSEIIKNIAGNVKGWAGNWDAVWDNIILRGKIKQEIVEMSKKMGKKELMEGKFNSLSNEAFHRISDDVREDEGSLNSERIFEKWKEWALKKSNEF
jgi:archaeal flagellar protein FlaI